MYLWNKQSPSNLSGFRPNQAADRVYAGWASPRAMGPLSGLGAFGDATDPTTWLVGAGALLGAWWLFSRKRGGGNGRRIARLAAQRALATRDLKALE